MDLPAFCANLNGVVELTIYRGEPCFKKTNAVEWLTILGVDDSVGLFYRLCQHGYIRCVSGPNRGDEEWYSFMPKKFSPKTLGLVEREPRRQSSSEGASVKLGDPPSPSFRSPRPRRGAPERLNRTSVALHRDSDGSLGLLPPSKTQPPGQKERSPSGSPTLSTHTRRVSTTPVPESKPPSFESKPTVVLSRTNSVADCTSIRTTSSFTRRTVTGARTPPPRYDLVIHDGNERSTQRRNSANELSMTAISYADDTRRRGSLENDRLMTDSSSGRQSVTSMKELPLRNLPSFLNADRPSPCRSMRSTSEKDGPPISRRSSMVVARSDPRSSVVRESTKTITNALSTQRTSEIGRNVPTPPNPRRSVTPPDTTAMWSTNAPLAPTVCAY